MCLYISKCKCFFSIQYLVYATAALTLQFAICYQRAAKSDSTDVGSKIRNYLGEVGCRVCSEVWVLNHVFSHTGEHSSQANQTVESSHQLGQVTDLDLLSNGQA